MCVLQVKVLTNPGSNVPLATPVAISTTLPPMVSALSQQGSNSALPAPSFHRTNTSLAPAPSSGAQSPAIQLFLSQLSAYVKGTPSFSSFSVTLSAPAWPACFTHFVLLDWMVVMVVRLSVIIATSFCYFVDMFLSLSCSGVVLCHRGLILLWVC